VVAVVRPDPQDLNPSSEQFRQGVLEAGVFAGYLVLAIIHTYPLVLHLGTHLPGQGIADNASFVWNLWWMREALASSSASFFISPMIEAPVGGSLILHTHTALTAFAGATLLAPVSVVAAQNVLIIASLALNGLATSVLSRTAGAARGPAFLAGALFVVTPPVAARLMGHYNLLLVWPLAFACAAYLRWWRRPRVWTAVLLAATAALIPYADYYYAVFFALFVVGYGALRLRHVSLELTGRSRTRTSVLLFTLAGLAAAIATLIALSPAFELRMAGSVVSVSSARNATTVAWLLAIAAVIVRWRPRLRLTPGERVSTDHRRSVSLALVLFVILLVPLIGPAWAMVSSGDYVTQPSSLKSSPWGVDVVTLVLGPPFNGLLGSFIRSTYTALGIDVMESSAWLGLGPIALLLVALRAASPAHEVRRWVAIVGLFALWALGPYLDVAGHHSGILLPQAVGHVIPLVNNARIPGRALAVCALALAVAIAGALSTPAQRSRSSWTITLLIVFALAESLAAPLPLAPVGAPGVYARIAASDTAGSVLTIPFGVRDGFGEKGLLEHDALYGQTIHRRPLVGGFLARVPPRVWSWYEETEPYRSLLALSASATATTPVPTCESVVSGLRAASVAYVVLYPNDASATLKDLVTTGMPLRRIAEDDRRVLFQVDLTRPGPCPP
jgi:hypothetical protein